MTSTAPNATRRAEPPSGWVRKAAYAVPLCVLPSAIWRLVSPAAALLRGDLPCASGNALEVVWVPSLSVTSLGLAWLTVGLVRPWGEVFPRWLPRVGGRPVPARAVTVAGYAGAGAIAALLLYGAIREAAGGGPLHQLPEGCHQPGADVLRWYLPLLLWPPLLALVTHDYWRRHRPGRDRVEAAA